MRPLSFGALAVVGLPDFANKNTGGPGKSEFQRNEEYFSTVCPKYYRGQTDTKDYFRITHLAFRLPNPATRLNRSVSWRRDGETGLGQKEAAEEGQVATEQGSLKDTHEDKPARTSGSPLWTPGRRLGAEDHPGSGPSIRGCAGRHGFCTAQVS